MINQKRSTAFSLGMKERNQAEIKFKPLSSRLGNCSLGHVMVIKCLTQRESIKKPIQINGTLLREISSSCNGRLFPDLSF